MGPIKNANLIEVNSIIFLKRLSRRYRKHLTLAEIPTHVWKDYADKGFHYVWLMGLWRRSPGSRKCALSEQGLRKDYDAALPDWKVSDVMGSPYAIYSYTMDESLGKTEELASLKKTINHAGLSLILDFVPNHLAIDHPLTLTHPEFFIRGSYDDHINNPGLFFETAKNCFIAHGKDPYFPAWQDTAQIDYSSPQARQAMIDKLLRIAPYADGLRCDMAMLVLNRVFEKTWGPFLSRADQQAREFWPDAISEVKSCHPEFTFIAEAYWGLEWELQQLGFDYTYDKRLYDRMVHSDAKNIRAHLTADTSYQSRSVRFIENHDEPRAVISLGKDRSYAAASIMATIEGLHLFHEGQPEGNTLRHPVQLIKQLEEDADLQTKQFYDRLSAYINDDVLMSGKWSLLECVPAWKGNNGNENMLAWIWSSGDAIRKLIVVNYSADISQARVMLPGNHIKTETMVFRDILTDTVYERESSELKTMGLYVDLAPWKVHLFDNVV